MDKEKISLEQTLALEDAVAYLEDLAAGLRAGRLLIAQGDRSMELTPPDSVDIEVEARQKKGKVKFSLELEWQPPIAPSEEVVITPLEPGAAPGGDDVPDLRVGVRSTATEPLAGAPAPEPGPKPRDVVDLTAPKAKAEAKSKPAKTAAKKAAKKATKKKAPAKRASPKKAPAPGAAAKK